MQFTAAMDMNAKPGGEGMKRVTLIATALLIAVLAVLTSRAAAQETNVQEVTYLTFSNTVEMPGVTLPAGTYMFRLADTPSRNVVQVLDRDGKDIKGQWLFVQSERPEVTGDTVIMFKENREGATPAIQYWYFPGEKIGKEFIYPKEQAQRIAARTGQQVRTESGYVKPESTEANNVVNGGGVPPANNDADNTLRNAPAASQPTASAGSVTGNRGISSTPTDNSSQTAVATSGSSSSAPVGTTGSSSSQAPTQTARPTQLPKTASPLPISGLIGLLSLAGALRARVAARR
jgi:hypothetical protein